VFQKKKKKNMFPTNSRFNNNTRSTSNSTSSGVTLPITVARIPAIFTQQQQQQSSSATIIDPRNIIIPPQRPPIVIRSSSVSHLAPKRKVLNMSNVPSTFTQQIQQRQASSSTTITVNGTTRTSSSSTLRQTFATRQTNHELDQIQRLGMTLDRLNEQVSKQLAAAQVGRQRGAQQQYQPGEDPESKSLIQRAVDLNRRLRVLKHKLNLANEYYSTPEAMTTYTNAREMGIRNQQREDLLTRQRQEQQRLQMISSSNDDEANGSNNAQNSFQIILQKLNEDIDPENAPRDFICPISQCVMIDPVRTSDGHCYDRASIAEWFMTFDDHRMPTSPLTNLSLPSVELTPDDELREKILDFLRESRNKTSKEPVTEKEPSIRDLRGNAKNVNISGSGAEEIVGLMMMTNNTTTMSSSVSSLNNSLQLAPAPPRPRTPEAMISTTAPQDVRNLRLAYYKRNVGDEQQQVPPSAEEDRKTILTSPTRPSAINDAINATLARLATTKNSLSSTISALPREPARTQQAPIWSSSVVPSSEPNARALNLLRIDETIRLPNQENHLQTRQQNNVKTFLDQNNDFGDYSLLDDEFEQNQPRTFSFIPSPNRATATTSIMTANAAARLQNKMRGPGQYNLPRHSTQINNSRKSGVASTVAPIQQQELNLSSSGVRNLNQRRTTSSSGKR
jgi:hypothetical protein